MSDQNSVLAVEQQFFSALTNRDVFVLEQILSDDFLLIDLTGNLVTKAGLVQLVASIAVKVVRIERLESQVRFRGNVAVIVGRTEMQDETGAGEFSVQSRYTHVFAYQDSHWSMLSAQGTLIAPA